ncbi:MAG TPA: hemerythrin domain-containing protein [Bryobacteraceae bacterium]|nr:hemerythrin domain-containing protein [Bryobacteraceae bacterium]
MGEIAGDWTSVSLAELIAHLISQHHEYLQIELPRLQQRLNAVYETNRAQGSPTLASLPNLLFLMKDDLDLHMRKEELVLFPAIERLARQDPPSGSLSTPIRSMLSEHDSASGALDDIRGITRDYQLPHDASETYRALFQDFETLERRLRLHMYLEESVLFPRALSLECQRCEA